MSHPALRNSPMPTLPSTRRGPTGAVVSLAAHAAVLVVLLALGARARVHVVPQVSQKCCVAMLQVAGAARTLEAPVPDEFSTGHSHRTLENSQMAPKLPDPTRAPHPARASKDAQQAATSGPGSGMASSGNGSDAQNTIPAFPVFSPKPPVRDRALLPDSQQQIVVDVSVSAVGEVTGESLVKGIGNALDQLVLDTVKTWRFHPATVNGNPVASEAELIFPFTHDYPITAA